VLKGVSTGAITEEALQGEWSYLEEKEPLDRAKPEFFVLRDSKVQSNTKPNVMGKYAITDAGAVLTSARRSSSKV
jgi:hypothetical protein